MKFGVKIDEKIEKIREMAKKSGHLPTFKIKSGHELWLIRAV